DALTLPLDADALEHLDAAAGALDHLEMHANGVAGLELGHLAALAVLDVVDHRHGRSCSSSGAAEWYQRCRGPAFSRSAPVSAVSATPRSRRGGRTGAPPAPPSRGTPRAACSGGTRGRRPAPGRRTPPGGSAPC